MKEPKLFSPIFTGVVKLFAFFTLARTKTIGLSNINRFKTSVNRIDHVFVNKFLDIRIRNTILCISGCICSSLAIDECEILRMSFSVFFSGYCPFVSVAAKQCVNHGKSVVCDVVKTASCWMGGVEFNRGCFNNVEVCGDSDGRNF